jgi:predicted double-glycine peptidase
MQGPARVEVTSWRDIPFRTIVRQRYDFSCGSAAVATMLTYSYGLPTTENDAFSAMWSVGDQKKIIQSGFSLLDMKHYLNRAASMPGLQHHHR